MSIIEDATVNARKFITEYFKELDAKPPLQIERCGMYAAYMAGYKKDRVIFVSTKPENLSKETEQLGLFAMQDTWEAT